MGYSDRFCSLTGLHTNARTVGVVDLTGTGEDFEFSTKRQDLDASPDEDPFVLSTDTFAFLMLYGALVIFQAAVPRLTALVLYDILLHTYGPPMYSQSVTADTPAVFEKDTKDPPNAYYTVTDWAEYPIGGGPFYSDPPIPYIRYGPLAHTMEQEVVLYRLAGKTFQEAKDTWRDIFSNPNMSPDGRVKEAWLGKGNLWAVKSPGQFPVAEAMAAPPLTAFPFQETSIKTIDRLPLEVVELILEFLTPHSIFVLTQVHRSLRHLILPHVHQYAFKSISRHTPHLFPAMPFKLEGKMRGKEEIATWIKRWAKAGVKLRKDDWKKTRGVTQLPWMIYAREATKSPSMRNRRRIWGIGLQFDRFYDVLNEVKATTTNSIPYDSEST